MRLLAFDTAGEACSAALWQDGRVVSHRRAAMARGHAEALIPMVGTVLAEADAAFAALDALAVTTGPGSFTGLRVGLAAARGFALALKLPVIGVGTLEALAEATPEEERAGRSVIAALDARRGEVYWQAFDAGLHPLSAPAAAPADGVTVPTGPLLLVGSGAAALAAAGERAGRELRLSAAPASPDAAFVATLAARRKESAGPGTALRPLYLRAAATEAPPP